MFTRIKTQIEFSDTVGRALVSISGTPTVSETAPTSSQQDTNQKHSTRPLNELATATRIGTTRGGEGMLRGSGLSSEPNFEDEFSSVSDVDDKLLSGSQSAENGKKVGSNGNHNGSPHDGQGRKSSEQRKDDIPVHKYNEKPNRKVTPMVRLPQTSHYRSYSSAFLYITLSLSAPYIVCSYPVTMLSSYAVSFS